MPYDLTHPDLPELSGFFKTLSWSWPWSVNNFLYRKPIDSTFWKRGKQDPWEIYVAGIKPSFFPSFQHCLLHNKLLAAFALQLCRASILRIITYKYYVCNKTYIPWSFDWRNYNKVKLFQNLVESIKILSFVKLLKSLSQIIWETVQFFNLFIAKLIT